MNEQRSGDSCVICVMHRVAAEIPDAVRLSTAFGAGYVVAEAMCAGKLNAMGTLCSIHAGVVIATLDSARASLKEAIAIAQRGHQHSFGPRGRSRCRCGELP